jgi:ribonuclease HIII
MVVFTNVKKEDVKKLKQLKFIPEAPKTMYETIRYKKGGVIAILYDSGKLLLQGKEEAVEKVAIQLGRKKIGELKEAEKFRRETGTIIGSDESLKGDTFGGLVVAAVKADKKMRDQLKEIGVADSKTLSDNEIVTMAEKIRKIVPCEVKSILPEEYNKEGKVTLMLNKLHFQCAQYLQPGKHVVDQYPGCNVGDIRETKAESKYIEVAAASVLARDAALKQFNYLSRLAKFPIPKGSTHVKLALHELKERGLDFNKFVKTSFRNVEEFL